MGNNPYYLKIHKDVENFLCIYKKSSFSCCPGTPPEKLKVLLKIKPKKNEPIDKLIELVNKIIAKFANNKFKNLTAFIIAFDNLLEYYLPDDEIKKYNEIIEAKINVSTLEQKVEIFIDLLKNLYKINNKKDIKNFIKTIKVLLVEDKILIDDEIKTFIGILNYYFLNNDIDGEESENNINTDTNTEIDLIEKNSNHSFDSNFSSYSKSSQNQIRKMEKEIKRLKKLIPKDENDKLILD